MKDFTLEELKQICYLSNYYINIHGAVNNITYTLRDKSKAMIDNYATDECPEVRDINCIEACPKCRKHHE